MFTMLMQMNWDYSQKFHRVNDIKEQGKNEKERKIERKALQNMKNARISNFCR